MPHVGRTKEGVTYALGCCGTGVALMTYLGTGSGRGWRVATRRRSRLRFPIVPAPYEGRPWFLPFAGEWFRLQDRLAARSRPSTPGSSRGLMPKPLAIQLYTFRDPARFGGAGWGSTPRRSVPSRRSASSASRRSMSRAATSPRRAECSRTSGWL